MLGLTPHPWSARNFSRFDLAVGWANILVRVYEYRRRAVWRVGFRRRTIRRRQPLPGQPAFPVWTSLGGEKRLLFRRGPADFGLVPALRDVFAARDQACRRPTLSTS